MSDKRRATNVNAQGLLEVCSAIGHRRRYLVVRGSVIRHMQRVELPWEKGRTHEARDLFVARAAHFENAILENCFEQLVPAMNPATVAGIGPLLGPLWPDSHQTKDGRAHIGCRSEVR